MADEHETCPLSHRPDDKCVWCEMDELFIKAWMDARALNPLQPDDYIFREGDAPERHSEEP